MTAQEQLREITGATAYDRDGDKIGKIGQVYYDDDTDQPKWVTVNTGLFGMNESFVPLQGAQFERRPVTLAYDKATIKDAPNVAGDRHLLRGGASSSTATTAWTTARGAGEPVGRHGRRDDTAAGVVGGGT